MIIIASPGVYDCEPLHLITPIDKMFISLPVGRQNNFTDHGRNIKTLVKQWPDIMTKILISMVCIIFGIFFAYFT
jgi:hypothetical protein